MIDYRDWPLSALLASQQEAEAIAAAAADRLERLAVELIRRGKTRRMIDTHK